MPEEQKTGEVTPWRKLRFYQRLARIGLGILMAGAIVALADGFYGALIAAAGLVIFAIGASIAEV